LRILYAVDAVRIPDFIDLECKVYGIVLRQIYEMDLRYLQAMEMNICE